MELVQRGCWCADRPRLKHFLALEDHGDDACSGVGDRGVGFFLDEDIVHTHSRDNHLVRPEDVQLMFNTIRVQRGSRKALLMVSVGDNTTMSNEARAVFFTGVESS